MANFYIVSAGAAATLIGLLFVAVQIGPPLAGAGRIGRRHAMARSTFSLFAILFGLSLYLMLPNQSKWARAEVLLAAAALGALRAILTWIPVWRDKLQGRVEFRLWQTTWLLVGPLVAYAFLALAGGRQLATGDAGLVDEAGAPWFIMLFVLGVRNSWELLVEAGGR